MGGLEGDFRIEIEALLPGDRDRGAIGADVLLKSMGVDPDVVGVACGVRRLSDPEGSVRFGEFGKSGDENSGHEVQEVVEGVQESEFRVVREFVGRGDAARIVRIDAISCWLRSIRGAVSTVGAERGRSHCFAPIEHRFAGLALAL